MFVSLRSKLIASYALVILLTLIIAGTGFAYVIRTYQAQLRLNQLADLLLPFTAQVQSLNQAGASPAVIAQYLADQANELNVRIFLVGPDRQILYDTGNDLAGQLLPQPSTQIHHRGGVAQLGTIQPPNSLPMTFISVNPRPPRPDSGPGPTEVDDRMTVVLTIPEARVGSAWLQLAPSLLGAAAIALVLGIAVALVLARSIARPLAQVTRASEKMARGDFDQYIDVAGPDEIGQLASSFNEMAREVGLMHRTMRDLLANVSHELRTPLTSIEGFAQAMQDGTIRTPSGFADAARIIDEESGRMHRLVEDLLDLSKLEAGQLEIVSTPIDLAELLGTCLRQVRILADSARVTVSQSVEELPAIVGDHDRLQQVFLNLLDNGLKNTPPGGTVEIRARTVARPDGFASVATGSAPPAGWIAVEVHNSGSFIAPAEIERIFERFYQVDRARQHNGQGSGLGLAIVQEIVQAHHGQVAVKSGASEGTTFTVYLPAAAPSNEPVQAASWSKKTTPVTGLG